MKSILLISESVIYLNNAGKICAKGGGEISIYKFAKIYHALGFDVTVLGMNENCVNDSSKIGNVQYNYFNVGNRKSIKDVIAFLRYAIKFSRNFDHILLNQFTPHLILVFIFFRKQVKGVLIHDLYKKIRFWINTFGFWIGSLGYLVEKSMLLLDRIFANYVIAVSEETKSKIGFNKNVSVVPNYIDEIDYEPVDIIDRNYILFVGRFVDYKRPNDVLYVLDALLRVNSDLNAIFIVSRFEQQVMDSFIELVLGLNLKKNVKIIMDPLSNDEVYSYMKNALLLVHPSVQEGQGLVVYESLQLGIPVVAYDLSVYNSELKGLFLSPQYDVVLLVNSALKVLENRDKSYLGSCPDFLSFESVKSMMAKKLGL
jgi:glycosyltransferase involved in cell wall biosynthesis